MSSSKYCALVTGVASRQGVAFALAEGIAASGACKCLILVDKDNARLLETHKFLAARHPSVEMHALNYDVVNLSDLSNMYLEARRRVLSADGSLDIVINAVGASNVSDFETDSTYLLRGLVDTSLTHLLLSTKMAFDLMCKAAVSHRRNCLILNVSSDAGMDPVDPFRAAESVARAGVVTMARSMQPIFDFLVAKHWDQNGDHSQPGTKPGRVRICTLLFPAELPTPAGVKDQELQRRITLGTQPALLEAVFPTLAATLAGNAASGSLSPVTATTADVAAAAKWIIEDLTLAGRVIRVGAQKNDIWAVKFQAAPSAGSAAPPGNERTGRLGLAPKTAPGAQKSATKASTKGSPQSGGLLGRLRTGIGGAADDHAPAGIASELIKLEDVELRPPREGIRMKL